MDFLVPSRIFLNVHPRTHSEHLAPDHLNERLNFTQFRKIICRLKCILIYRLNSLPFILLCPTPLLPFPGDFKRICRVGRQRKCFNDEFQSVA